MIQVVSFPPDLSKWDPDRDPFYLELYGETSPELDWTESQPDGSSSGGTSAASRPVPTYEYRWTIGHPGGHRHTEHLWPLRKRSEDLWEELEEPAARAYIFFPQSGGWRIEEVLATVKYLRPVYEQEKLTQQAAETFQKISPYVEDISKLAGLVPNPAFTAASSLLGTVAKLQLNDVPRADGFDWSVAKVTFGSRKYGVMQGVMWTLPKKMFTVLGGRLTGSVAVSFLPAMFQKDGTVVAEPAELAQLPVLAHAVVYGHAGERWSPRSKSRFIELQVKPVFPSDR
jgi:hypothetical protein